MDNKSFRSRIVRNINNKIESIKIHVNKNNIIEEVSGNKTINKWIILSGSIFIIIIVILTIQVFSIDSKREVISKLEIALEENNINQLSKIVRVEDEKINKEDLVPVMNYIEFKKYNPNEIILDILNNEKSLFFEIKKEDTFLGENFYIDIEKVSLRIKNDIENVDITLEEAGLNYENKMEIQIEVVPGLHTITYNLETEYGKSTGSEVVAIINDEIIDVEPDVRYITLQSNIYDADVFINNEKINKIVEEVKGYGPIPNDVNIKVKLEKESPWGILESEEVIISESNNINIYLDIVNDKFIDDVEGFIEEFYSDIFNALNDEDLDKIEGVDDETKFKIYHSLYEDYFIFRDKYSVDSFHVDIEKSECEYINGNYKANILTKVDYEISKKILPFIKETREEVFLVNLIYKNSQWQVEDFQKIEIY